MNLARFALKNRALSYFVSALLLFGGILSFTNLGQLEDPAFTVKVATIATTYPGASPQEVELEVTDPLERAIQEMAEIDTITSYSRAGLSVIEVEVKPRYGKNLLPQVWDKLRRKVSDTEESFPDGVGRPDVGDDFGEVFGFQLAVTSDGFSYRDLEDYAEALKKNLSLIDGVARVDLVGTRTRAIYLEASQVQLSQLQVTTESIASTLQNQNAVVDAGSLDLPQRRLRVAPTGAFHSPKDIAELTIRGSGDDAEFIRIRDIATVREGYVEPPRSIVRYDGRPAIGISISNEPGINVVDLGEAVEARLNELTVDLPIGVEVAKVHWQSDVVSEAVSGFLVSFAQAVGIVILVLTIFMGFRSSAVIGLALIFTLLASFIIMMLLDYDLQRMSLGALIVALGMMVDNAIVVVRRLSAVRADRRAMDRCDRPR